MPTPSSDSPKSDPRAGSATGFTPGSPSRSRSLRPPSEFDLNFDGFLTTESPSLMNEAWFSGDGEIAPKVGAPSMGGLDDQRMGLYSSASGFKVSEAGDKAEEVDFLKDPDSEIRGIESFTGQDPLSTDSRCSGSKGKAVLFNCSERRGGEGSRGFLNLQSGQNILKRGMDFANHEDMTVENSEYRVRKYDDVGKDMPREESSSVKRSKRECRGNEEYGKVESLSTLIDAIKLLSEYETPNIASYTVKTDCVKLVDVIQLDSNGANESGMRKVGSNNGNGIGTPNMNEGTSWDDNAYDSQRINVFPIHETGLGLELKGINLSDNKNSDVDHLAYNAAIQDQEQLENANTTEQGSRRNEYMGRFRKFAKENASRFAHFTPDQEDSFPEAHIGNELENWPGPFSSAMKIIRDREMKSRKMGCTSSESLPASITWVPRSNQEQIGARVSVPSLRDLCLNILVKNADAIVSLENIPDALKHKLSQLLCDSRKMNSHIFELIVTGSPTEIRLRDCSWMTEEQFTKAFQLCDTTNLMVLQLDQCGRCTPDYVVLATLVQLPRLTSLSLSGACRLSDRGLCGLVSSTSSLRSINLSQCSLLTSTSIYTLADSLGSLLKELYLDDCQSIDAALIGPALQKLEHLEVLSVAGIQTVCDEFIKNFVIARGQNLKELVLKDCVKLTDSSVKIIAEFCPGLRSLDLMNLCKLTDSSIGYLTNGCQALHTLKLCRNPFSDEAIAAFLETTGGLLEELSLNNVKKVGYHTTLSLASCARKLHTLDLSWCRNLTDNALGLIVDSCLSLRLLKLFGCSQITDVFLCGHSNGEVRIIGCKNSPLLQHVKVPDPGQGALLYSPAP